MKPPLIWPKITSIKSQSEPFIVEMELSRINVDAVLAYLTGPIRFFHGVED